MFVCLETAALSLYVKKTPSLFNIYRNPHFLKIVCLPKWLLLLDKLPLLIGLDKGFLGVDVAQQGRVVEERGTYGIFSM